MKILKQYKIPTIVNTVLTKYSIDHMEYLLDIASQYGAKVSFQIVDPSRSDEPDISPSKDQIRNNIEKLQSSDKRKHCILSTKTLSKMLDWPNQINQRNCPNSKFCRYIDEKGTVRKCTKSAAGIDSNNGILNSFDDLETNECKGCFQTESIEFMGLLKILGLIRKLNKERLLDTYGFQVKK